MASSAEAKRKTGTDSTALLLVGVLLLALALRVYGVAFGLPELYYWDEPTVVNRAVRFGSGDLNPTIFIIPLSTNTCSSS